MQDHSVVVIGGGPAGLTAAYELVKRGVRPIVFEQDRLVGGIARTEEYKGYRYDIGGHRFYTKVGEVEQFWHEVLGDKFLKRPRMSRIYYRGQFYKYPLALVNTLINLGPVESFLILVSYLRARFRSRDGEETFEDWVTNRFGKRLFNTFFKTYTEKVWGIPCSTIRAEWAAQRIKGLSLRVAVVNALFKVNNTKTLIEEFDYPALGPGQMWEHCQAAIEQMGGAVRLQTSIERLRHKNGRVTHVTARNCTESYEVGGEHVVSSMPINELIFKLDPPPPAEVLDAAHGLKHRAFLQVGLIINQPEAFPDNWIYIHSPEVHVGRIQNFKNWSPQMVPDHTKTSLGMEYFCDEDPNDAIWGKSDAELIELAKREIEQLGLAKAADVVDGVVIRQPKAYPVYDDTYRKHLDVIQRYLQTFENLQTIGRNGMHRYNNQDHSMLTGMLAARNIMGEQHDLWDVNTERSYYEEFTSSELKARAVNEAAQSRAAWMRADSADSAS
jgi:protoporphyrinogen oxidase